MLPPAPHTELPCLLVTPVACPGLGESGPQLLSWLRRKDGAAGLAVPADDLAVQRGPPHSLEQDGHGLARRGWAGVLPWLRWANRLACTSSPQPEPGRSHLDHVSAHLGCCSPCSADLLPHPGLHSALPGPGKSATWAHGPALPGLHSVGPVSASGIMLAAQRDGKDLSCPFHLNPQGEGVPSRVVAAVLPGASV